VSNIKMKRKCIVVYYDGDNFNETIDHELKRRGIKEGEAQIMALPKSLKKMGILPAHTRKNK